MKNYTFSNDGWVMMGSSFFFFFFCICFFLGWGFWSWYLLLHYLYFDYQDISMASWWVDYWMYDRWWTDISDGNFLCKIKTEWSLIVHYSHWYYWKRGKMEKKFDLKKKLFVIWKEKNICQNLKFTINTNLMVFDQWLSLIRHLLAEK